MASSSPAKNKISVSASSLLSSSSPSMPSRPNPKPRNSETGDLMRRSFRGNPFPADSSRRNSVGNSRVEFGDKENHQSDKDLISNVVVNKGPKGSKHFMSPTISAVSKINPSPRKKILSDKNEMSRSFDKTHHQVKSSVSFSDVISIIGEYKDHDEICIDEKKHFDIKESYDTTVTDFDENLENQSNDGSSFMISPLPPSVPYTFPVFESHDVDPLVAPYDPKKNYLSPRPQFLHYKPNPRIEHHFDECKQLVELFSSSSDTDLSAEESQQEEEVDSPEGVVSVEVAEETQDVGGEERLEAPKSDKEEEEEKVCESVEEETHQVSKRSRVKMSTLLGWIMVVGVAYVLLVSSVTLTQPSIIESSPFYQFQIPTQVTKSARETYEQVSVNLVMWVESSLVYIDKLISSLREEEGYGPFQFHNLTILLEDKKNSDTVFQTSGGEVSVDEFLVDSKDWSLEMDGEEEELEEEPENSGEIRLETVYEEDGNEVEQESEGGEVNSEMIFEFDEQAEIKIATDTDTDTDTEVSGGERYSKTLSEEVNGGQETDNVEGQREYEENDQKNSEEGHVSETGFAQNDEKNREEYESNSHQLDDVESATISGPQQKEIEVANAETVAEEEGVGEIVGNSIGVSEEATDVEHDGNDLEEDSGFGEVVNDAGADGILLSNHKKVVVVCSTVMVILAAAAAGFLLAKKKTKPVKMQREDCEPTTISATEVEHVPVENLIKERLSSLNFKEEEEDEVGDVREREVSSFPSEMSFSFSKNKSLHSCSNNRDDPKEYQSGGGGKKSNDSGESMASSASEYSIGSVSYGSFTTYERIQKRSGHKEKEMITPVRRSSRIRNHQHSGQ
ncbi:hypothetical protein CARUB_v10008298mg [Capsella rubella]|uniref:Transmembrane protein n=1 Tax=Capsella rubella TaxID=81985 RepID=R0IIS6_9BRAS|nr:uncharacterized protein LOC17900823 [Capsella rubella]EOA36803.1 hypothetical protein CARUB_v10008298mg [Capsella rubella]